MTSLKDIDNTIATLQAKIFVLQKSKVIIFNDAYKHLGVSVITVDNPNQHSLNGPKSSKVWVVNLNNEEEVGFACNTSSAIEPSQYTGHDTKSGFKMLKMKLYSVSKNVDDAYLFSIRDFSGALQFGSLIVKELMNSVEPF